VRTAEQPPDFLEVSAAGWFKGKDPTTTGKMLATAWVADVPVVYVGKAANLSTRLTQYRRHGAGAKVGHWGGRYIWQLADRDDLLVAWKATPGEDPEDAESTLIDAFIAAHGALPFANLKKGRRRADAPAAPMPD